MPEAYRSLAFVDTEIPLPGGENMLPPKFEARVLQEAAPRKHETVLEIGAGSGYMAALLAHRALHVTTVEISPELKAMAERNLSSYGVDNVDVVLGNGAEGWEGSGQFAAPYDVIIISGSLPVLPEAFLRQLKVGGRLLCVVGERPVMQAQLISRTSDAGYHTRNLFETSVTPLRQAAPLSHFTF